VYPCLPINRIGLMHLFLSLMLSLTLLGHSLAQEIAIATNTFKGTDSAYRISIEDHRITLKAEDASLKSILEAIGQQMDIEVVARIPEEEKITVQFEDQSLEEALKRFKVNYALVADSKEKDGRIQRIVVVPEGQQANLAMTASGGSDQKNKSKLKK